ncbi:MAG: enoyl-CoA hydratase/isomerase family protein [Rhodocyclales bacterium]|nr:enoyl-CoA hydratase/isomerase family protein [Rhodocyclales bacterium]
MYRNIVTEVDQGVGIITLNRADRHNAFDGQTVGELIQALAGMAGDSAARVVVISSTGKTFCAGADLEWMRTAAKWTSAENEADARVLAEMLHRLATLPKPTIARVQGPAYGGGVGLIAACDIAVATFEAQFALSEVKLGLIPATISPHVIAAIGERHARRYMLTAERFSAAEAYRLGLLHEMVADEAALDQALGAVIDALLANGPGALAECKDLIRNVTHRPLDAALIAETARRIARVRAGEEGRQGIAAFLEGRKPNWVK